MGHCQRHPELKAHQVVLWEPKHGRKRRGRQAISFVGVLKKDTRARTGGNGEVVSEPGCGRLDDDDDDDITQKY